jgi:hypothetical protein
MLEYWNVGIMGFWNTEIKGNGLLKGQLNLE